MRHLASNLLAFALLLLAVLNLSAPLVVCSAAGFFAYCIAESHLLQREQRRLLP